MEHPLRKWRKAHGLSQAALAKLLGVKTQGSIGHIEQGRRPASGKLARMIEYVTNGEITREKLRPDLFGEINVRRRRAA